MADIVDSLTTKSYAKAGVAIPGRINRETGTAEGYGNLNWGLAPVKSDLEKMLNCTVAVDNDAKLAGLSEALLLKDKYRNVMYVTIGTGIGTAVIYDGNIDPATANGEGGQILVEKDGERLQWEDLVSGKAIVERFGQRASDITDSKIWKEIANDIALGLIDLIFAIQPQVIVFGGGVSVNFDKFSGFLYEKLKEFVLFSP